MIQRSCSSLGPGVVANSAAGVMAVVVLALGAACGTSPTAGGTAQAPAPQAPARPLPAPPPPAPPPLAASPPAAPPSAPVAPLPEVLEPLPSLPAERPAPTAPRNARANGGDGPIDDMSAAVSAVLATADPWRGKRVRHDTAVLLVAARLRDGDSDGEADTGRIFQPLVCSIAGKREIGARCGEIMPANATIRTPGGELSVTRSSKPFHDEAGGQDYPAPYGPACCMYNTCVGKTVPYSAAHGAKAATDPHTIFAVWPSDADIALEVAPAGLVGVTAKAVVEIEPHQRQRVDQAFKRGKRRYAAVHGRGSAAVVWDVGAGWVIASGSIGARGYTLLATTDVDHDGHLELISYQQWANDYGLDVYGDSDPDPIYGFSCGNI